MKESIRRLFAVEALSVRFMVKPAICIDTPYTFYQQKMTLTVDLKFSQYTPRISAFWKICSHFLQAVLQRIKETRTWATKSSYEDMVDRGAASIIRFPD